MTDIRKTVTYTDEGRPEIRSNPLAAYDTDRDRFVTFGGFDNAILVLGDTQEYAPIGNLWTRREPITPPTARAWADMAYDPDRLKFVTFGGVDDTVVLGGTSEYTPATGRWDAITTATVPAARVAHGMAYDTVRDLTIMFGGIDSTFTTFLNELYEYNGTDWTLASPVTTGIYTTPPTGRASIMMAYDPVRALTVIVGGTDLGGNKLEVWLWDGMGFRQQTSAVFPDAAEMTGGALAFVPFLGKIAMLGGNNGVGAPNRTWLLDENGFEEVVFPTGATLPTDRTSVGSSRDDKLFMFAGATPTMSFNDLWGFDGTAWAEERTGFEFDKTLVEVDEGAKLKSPFSIANPSVLDATGVQMDGLTAFSDTVTAAGGDSVQYAFEIDGTLKWFDTSVAAPLQAWADADGTFAESNAAAEVNTNTSTFPVSSGGSLVRIRTFLHSFDGTTTPEAEAAHFDHDPAEEIPETPSVCKVFGWVRDEDTDPVNGAIIRVTPSVEAIKSGHFITAQIVDTSSDATGFWEIDLFETATVPKATVTLEIITMRHGQVATKSYPGLTVPDQEEIPFTDLVA